jgi:hypothetical protein
MKPQRMYGKRILCSVYLDPPVLKDLRKLCKASGFPIALHLREAVADLLVKHKIKVRRSAAAAAKHK